MSTSIREKQPRSPIKETPLPQAGESLAQEFNDVLLDVAGYLAFLLAMATAVVLSWLYYLRPSANSPVTLTVIGAICFAYVAWKWRKKWSLLRDIALGRKGERAVADALEPLKELGYRIYHDVQEDGYNIDHVLIGPGGVFAVETKTRRKRGNQTVVFDGEEVTVAGHKPDRDPIVQGKASARRVRDILKEQTGDDIPVKPVVLFPGWFVEIRKPNRQLFVGNPRFFIRSFDYEHSEETLSADQIKTLAAGLERHLRRERAS